MDRTPASGWVTVAPSPNPPAAERSIAVSGHEPIIWNDSFTTHLPELDDHHRALVHTLNEANAKLAGNSSIETLGRITRDLLIYALCHFEAEEGMMKQYGYVSAHAADAEHHVRQHRDFSARVVAVRSGLQTGKVIAPADLLAFLNDWLVDHILTTDKKLGAFVAARRAVPA
jgi:hemerythrin-like metal-binding protein